MTITYMVISDAESFRHSYQVDFPEVTISTAGVGGIQTLRTVTLDKDCRAMELSITHMGTEDTKIQLIKDANVMVTILCPPQATSVWSSQLGRKFGSEEDIEIQGSNVVGGNTYISGSGVEV